ncbi:MAG TPA: hypothetical protein VGN52_07600 [Burkholderiales bacterium]
MSFERFFRTLGAILAFALALALFCEAADAAPRGGGARSSGSRGAWHHGGGTWHGSPRHYYYRPFIPLPPPPLFWGSSSYYPGYYGLYDSSGAYLPPQDQGPTTYIEAPPGSVQQPNNYITSPEAATPQLPLEQRVQRLKDMCDKGLFTPEECAGRRQELLNQM